MALERIYTKITQNLFWVNHLIIMYYCIIRTNFWREIMNFYINKTFLIKISVKFFWLNKSFIYWQSMTLWLLDEIIDKTLCQENLAISYKIIVIPIFSIKLIIGINIGIHIGIHIGLNFISISYIGTQLIVRFWIKFNSL